MSWYEIADGRLRFRGRITKQPFLDWTASDEGSAEVEAAASQIRFALLGRARTARRRMCRELQTKASSEAMRSLLAAEANRYLAEWTELAYAPSLPRINVGLQRLVVIPRTMILARTLSALTARLAACRTLDGVSEPFTAYFCRRILRELDDAVLQAKPSAQRPVRALESWACVAVDTSFTWIDPMWSGPEWLGHVLLFEMPPAGLPRRQRAELEATIQRLTNDLSSMSRPQRDGTVRTASAGMRPVRV